MGVAWGAGAVTCWWKGQDSSSHSRASWWHSRTIRAGPSGTHTSMARASGTQAWVKTGPVEQVGVSQHWCPTRDAPRIPPSLTRWLGSNQMATADGQASVRDGAEGDEDLPSAFHREAVELHLPLQGELGVSGTPMAPPSVPTVLPELTGELPGALRRCHTCSQPARLDPSSRKLSCSPRTSPSSARNQRGVLTRVGGRTSPFPPPPMAACPAPPPVPLPAAGSARRTRRQGRQGCAGRHRRALLSARAGGCSGGPGRAGRRQRGELSVRSAGG